MLCSAAVVRTSFSCTRLAAKRGETIFVHLLRCVEGIVSGLFPAMLHA